MCYKNNNNNNKIYLHWINIDISWDRLTEVNSVLLMNLLKYHTSHFITFIKPCACINLNFFYTFGFFGPTLLWIEIKVWSFSYFCITSIAGWYVSVIRKKCQGWEYVYKCSSSIQCSCRWMISICCLASQ